MIRRLSHICLSRARARIGTQVPWEPTSYSAVLVLRWIYQIKPSVGHFRAYSGVQRPTKLVGDAEQKSEEIKY